MAFLGSLTILFAHRQESVTNHRHVSLVLAILLLAAFVKHG